MSSITGVPAPLVAPLYGALYLSSIMCTALYGVGCMQTFFYYIQQVHISRVIPFKLAYDPSVPSYQKDPLRMKLFVAALWMVNTIHEGLIISGTYKYIVTSLEDPSTFLAAWPELILQLLVMTPVALSTQGFFVYRIYIFSNKNIIAPLVWGILAIYQLVSALIYVSKTLYTENGSVHVVPLTTIGDEFLAGISVSYCSVAAGIDVLIATFMTYLLISRRDAVGFKSTARILERLTVFAINSGIWTAIFSLLAAILVQVLSSNLIYAVFFIPLCSIYLNSLLANLNARKYIKEGTATQHGDSDVTMSVLGPRIKGNRVESETDTRLISSTMDSKVWKTTEVVTFTDESNDRIKAESV